MFFHGTFSNAQPSTVPPPPDAYRSPGYPWLLALCMYLQPQGSGWYQLALQLQVFIGSATVLLTALLARLWLKPAWALLAGIWLALWPHHVAATGALLSEVVFGFTLVTALYCFSMGWRHDSRWWYVAAGASFGYAYLVNPLIALFPPCLAAMLWWLKHRRSQSGVSAMLLLAVFLIPILAMGLRNATLEGPARGSINRAAINFVQGSWPQYHAAANRFRSGDPMAVAIMQEIDRETKLLERDPQAGLAAVVNRFGNDPVGFANWYLAGKPLLLWDWQIRMGASDLHVLDVRNSPWETSPALRSYASILRTINPGLTVLMLAIALGLLFLGWRHAPCVPAAATGALAVYLTLMHVLLQAEPRYAIAYRGIEGVLVMTALAMLVRRLRRARTAAPYPGPT